MKIKIFVTVITLSFFLKVAAQKNTVNTDFAENTSIKAKEVSGSFEMNYLRHYLWRGAEFGNNDVAQPELVLTHNNFSLSFCANLNYIPENVPKEFYTRKVIFDEQDIEMGYKNKWGKFDCEFKAMAYFYFSQINSPATAELYNWTGYPVYKGLSVFTENSIDVISYRGAVYSNNGLYFEHAFAKNINIEWSAYAGFANKKFNAAYFETASGGLNLIGSNLVVSKDIGHLFIKVRGELNHYTNNNIKVSTGLKGTENFGFAAGINF